VTATVENDGRELTAELRINAEGAGKVAWVFRVGGRAEIAWSEVTRVKPYKDRFGVEIGDG
jgi:hypothetical protein